MSKFNRTYKLDIFTPEGTQITIQPPFTIKFSVKRNTLASANKATITITNLGESTRNQIYKDRYKFDQYWKVTLQAGYGDSLSTLFIGSMYEAYSVKVKNEWLTTIDCFDGMQAIQNGSVNTTISKDSTVKSVFDEALSNLPQVQPGSVSLDEAEKQARGCALFGNSLEIMEQITGKTPYIDNGRVYLLDDNEILPKPVLKLDSSDLLETPRRRETFLTIKAIFQPEAHVGRVYEIESKEKKYSGQYKVMGLTHDVETPQPRSTILVLL